MERSYTYGYKQVSKGEDRIRTGLHTRSFWRRRIRLRALAFNARTNELRLLVVARRDQAPVLEPDFFSSGERALSRVFLAGAVTFPNACWNGASSNGTWGLAYTGLGLAELSFASRADGSRSFGCSEQFAVAGILIAPTICTGGQVWRFQRLPWPL